MLLCSCVQIPHEEIGRGGLYPFQRIGLEARATDYALEQLSRSHLTEVRERALDRVERTRKEVHARLTYEINYWDNRGIQLALQEEAGKTPKLNSAKARAKAQELADRLQSRLHELDLEAQLMEEAGELKPRPLGRVFINPVVAGRCFQIIHRLKTRVLLQILVKRAQYAPS